MAAAYAGLVSLLNTMDLIHNHPRLSTSFDQCQNETLREKVDFLVEFMEGYSDPDSEEGEDLVSRISVAAHEAQDIIEVKAADRIRAGSTLQSPSFLPDLQNIIQDMDSIKENAIRLKKETRFKTQQPTTSMPPPSSSAPPATAKTATMVGFDSYVEQLLDQLTGRYSGLQILPIVGMGGIGKTTLVRNVYDKLLTVHLFDVHAWVTVSQECSAREILLQALYCLGRSTSKTDTTDNQLGHELHKILYCRRYLIVLDDVWSIEAWDKIKFFLPENNNRSRIVITSRLSELVDYFGSSALTLDFLDDRNSWNLFWEKTATMVGFDSYVEQLLGQLTGGHSGRQILPIVGMGGIGKTTLVRNVYDKLLTVHHFDVRAWVTVSQEYSVREILLGALNCLGRSTSKMDTTDDQLGEDLWKVLLGRRYLFVLDDVWSVNVWDKIKNFLPENNNGSRIVITTRLSELVDYFGSSALTLDFLDDHYCWNLFCEKTFAPESCPPELEEVGKNIVKKCEGLPLLIVVIAGLLRKSPRTQEYWEKIAKDKSLILNSAEGNTSLSILYLSYKHLPIWLKSCFLYLGLFPKDRAIDVPQLIKLWVAEGFIKSKTYQSMEEVAEKYIKDLVDRNLIIATHLRFYKLETCRVPDLVRDMCIMVAEKEKLFCMQRDIDGTRQFIVDERMAKSFLPRQSHTSETPSIVHPLILNGQRAASFKSRLLRVLFYVDGDHLESTFRQANMGLFSVDWGHLDSTFREVNLRFLFYEFNRGIHPYQLPSSISLLWSLQTIIIFGISTVVAPSEIWKMPQLRHIQVPSIRLPNPPPSCEHDGVFVLHNLQTLMNVQNLILSEDVCKRIPNMKELQIAYFFDEPDEASLCFHLHNLGCLVKLESLEFFGYRWEYVGDTLQNFTLPSSLRELYLEGSNLVWSDMEIIGSLPRLQILELRGKAVVGAEWICVEGQFFSLKHLYIRDCKDLIVWIADSSSFPVLETLSLWCLSRLDEIPLDIGEIPTLERMLVYGCSESATISAVRILEEQESLGNECLQLQLEFWNETEAKMWREKIEELGITAQNLHISGLY